METKEAAVLQAVIVGLGLAVAMVGAGRAAEPDVVNQARHRGARNELGVLLFCQERGLAAQAAIAAQQARISALPPVTPMSLGEQEEAEGRLGYLAFDGRQGVFAASAQAQGLSVETACAVRTSLALGQH